MKHVSGVILNLFLPYIVASDHFMMIYKVVDEDLSIICYFVKNQLTLYFTSFFTISKIDFFLIPIPMAVQSSSQKTFCAAWPCEHSQRVKSCTKCLWESEFAILIFVLYWNFLENRKLLKKNLIFQKIPVQDKNENCKF